MKSLARLVHLYGLLERRDEAAAGLAGAAVTRVSVAHTAQSEEFAQQQMAVRAALGRADSVEAAIAGSAAQMGLERTARLAALRAANLALHEQAVLDWRASRLRTAQVERVVNAGQQAAATIAARRAQSEADDRFAASRLRERMKAR